MINPPGKINQTKTHDTNYYIEPILKKTSQKIINPKIIRSAETSGISP
jgi:hypothetical protein